MGMSSGSLKDGNGKDRAFSVFLYVYFVFGVILMGFGIAIGVVALVKLLSF